MSQTYNVAEIPVRDFDALAATLLELNAAGSRCELRKKARPRNYYEDQFKRHLGRESEIADYVIHLPDSAYDVSLLQDKKDPTAFVPYFDPHAGSIGSVLGVPMEKGATDQRHHIGKLLSTYSRHAALNVATRQGLTIQNVTVNPDYSWHATANA